ncbi:hypothetical protein MMPV_006704 [Pyropia vietnamensis]
MVAVLLLGLDWLRPGRDPPVFLTSATIAAATADVARCAASHTLAVNGPDFHQPTVLAAVQQTTADPVIGVGACVRAERFVAPAIAALTTPYLRATLLVRGPQVMDTPLGDFLSHAYPGAAGSERGAGKEVLRSLLVGDGGSDDHGAFPAGYHPAGKIDDGIPAPVTAATSAGVTEVFSSPLITGWMPRQTFLRWAKSLPSRGARLATLNDVEVPYEVSQACSLSGQTVVSFGASLDEASATVRRNSPGRARVVVRPLTLLRKTALQDQVRGLQLVPSDATGVDAAARVESPIPHVVASLSLSLRD